MHRRIIYISVLLLSLLAFRAPPACAADITLRPPLAGSISQYFSTTHPAIDIFVPIGTAVHAAGDGTVTWASWQDGGGGLVVIVDHGSVNTLYAHLNDIVVVVNQRVAVGQVLGHSGMTGNTTGPHLHFGVQLNGVWVDPLRFVAGFRKPTRVPLPDTAMACP